MPHSLILGIPNRLALVLAIAVVAVVFAGLVLGAARSLPRLDSRIHNLACSGWLPASVLAVFATAVVAVYGVPPIQTLIFGAYVAGGIALPGMLWVRLLRGRPGHLSEDMAMGLAAGYCLEIAAYVPARAAGLPLAVLLWPIATIAAFAAIPGLRRHWHSDGTRRPSWWSWALAGLLGYVVIYSAGTFFATHALSGTDMPYVDMPYHLALIGELRYHMPPEVPFVSGLPLAYHWFYYAEAAATSWATGIEPVTLMYRLSALPMFVAFALLTATAAGRLVKRDWAGPLAVALALLAAVADPFRWVGAAVYDTQTLGLTWISPTNLFGLTISAATVLTLLELLQGDARAPRKQSLLAFVLVLGASGAKASLLPLLIGGLFVVVAGTAILNRRLHRTAALALLMTVVVFGLAAVVLYRGAAPGLVVGLESLRLLPAVNLPGEEGLSRLALPIAGLVVALLLWAFEWSGALALLARGRALGADARILFLGGTAAAALGAVALMYYPGMSQIYYLTAAAGIFGIIAAAGIADMVPERPRYLPLLGLIGAALLIGAAAVLVIARLGPAVAPTLAGSGLARTLAVIILPVSALLGFAVAASLVLRRLEPKQPVLQGATTLLVIALVMGYSLPSVAQVITTPLRGGPPAGLTVPGDGIDAARWLRDHSDPNDVVATNLHCPSYATDYASCKPVSFWVSAYTERRVLVEGWDYTTRTVFLASGQVAPFWDPARLAANDLAFTQPSAASVAELRDVYRVRWLLAELAGADSKALARYADLRYAEGDFAVYEILQK
jgi:hypothetical protein